MAIAAHPIKPIAATGPPKVLTAVVFIASASAVVGMISQQLATSKRVMDGRFAQYNTVASEENRKKAFEGAVEDPRKSLFNVLGW
ncbi:hypothetical protein V2G26_015068 [Clonostachys chloroleuca]